MAEKKKQQPEQKTFYRTDPLTGETTERIVVSPADEVRAKFEGYSPKQTRKSSKASEPADGSGDAAAGADPQQ